MLLSSAKKCEKDTIFDNLRIITQEEGIKTRQMTLFFSSDFQALFRKLIFLVENCKNLFSWGPPFGSFWSAKYLNFQGESCEIRILSRSIQNIYTLRKSKKPGFTFSSELRTNSKIFRVISWSNIIALTLMLTALDNFDCIAASWNEY